MNTRPNLALELIRRAQNHPLKLGFISYIQDYSDYHMVEISKEEATRLLRTNLIGEQLDWLSQNRLFSEDPRGTGLQVMNKFVIMYEVRGTHVHAIYNHDDKYFLVVT